jgi:hypothetical protein
MESAARRRLRLPDRYPEPSPIWEVFCIDLGLINIPFEAGLRLPASQYLRNRLRCISPVKPTGNRAVTRAPKRPSPARLESRNIATWCRVIHWRFFDLVRLCSQGFFSFWFNQRLSYSYIQRLELAEHCRYQFCDSRVNVHGALDHGIRRFGVHHIQDRMNHLIAFDTQE